MLAIGLEDAGSMVTVKMWYFNIGVSVIGQFREKLSIFDLLHIYKISNIPPKAILPYLEGKEGIEKEGTQEWNVKKLHIDLPES